MSYASIMDILEQCRRLELLTVANAPIHGMRHFLDAIRHIETVCDGELEYFRQAELAEDHKKEDGDVPF